MLRTRERAGVRFRNKAFADRFYASVSRPASTRDGGGGIDGKRRGGDNEQALADALEEEQEEVWSRAEREGTRVWCGRREPTWSSDASGPGRQRSPNTEIGRAHV